ncbi:MAG TPA: 2-oxoglutarate dehydrogenase complex dihydrolipoyllysine-residue succinyltransferase [Candidatus Sphingobacterium stercoripullorum]|nr:2-oxoglutarate dehydrogenase complex dihydrolipoyllysine-residue succinyltransferase [Candidatus Sphingobacterium stercoripullorum]
MALEIKIPAVGESISEVTIAEWLKNDGDYVEMDENIAELESDKATFELPAEQAGVLRIVVEAGETIEIGTVVAKIEAGDAPAAGSSSEKSENQEQEQESAAPASEEAEDNYAKGTASPAAAKILREKNIDPTTIKGTGKDGRITKADAENAVAQPKAQEVQKETKAPVAAPSVEGTAGPRQERKEKMSSLRRTIARRLVTVKNETAMLTTFNEVNMQPIMDIRSKYKELFKEKHGVGLGFMSFFTKAVTTALKEWPAVNGRIDGDHVVYHDYADVSIAVSTPKGLVVPVIRNAESLALHEIESKIIELAVKARDGKLTIEEMTGGTFTITNGGVFGSMMSTPIINAPQSAILGMHNIIQRPVAENGEVVIRPMMYIALSYDHRIIDGKESVSFLVRVKELLEDPSRLLLGV